MAEKLIWVQSGKNDGRVALFENDWRHPGGQAFVAEVPVQVARTTLVERKLINGELKEVDAPKRKPDEVMHKSKEEVEAEIEAMQATSRKSGRPPKERE